MARTRLKVGSRQELPASPEEAAEILRACADEGLPLRPRGGGTKLGWGRPAPDADVEVLTGHLGRVVEHNAGDLTAVLQAGVPLATAQETFAAAGQMLALDPPLRGPDPAGEAAATVGGVVATGDSGPLRHRYGAARDLLLGITVALSDGTLARAGGKVIKNVAGYDLAKLYAGSFGTLGLIVEVVVRLHPRPPRTASAIGRTDDAAALGRAARLVLTGIPAEQSQSASYSFVCRQRGRFHIGPVSVVATITAIASKRSSSTAFPNFEKLLLDLWAARLCGNQLRLHDRVRRAVQAAHAFDGDAGLGVGAGLRLSK